MNHPGIFLGINFPKRFIDTNLSCNKTAFVVFVKQPETKVVLHSFRPYCSGLIKSSRGVEGGGGGWGVGGSGFYKIAECLYVYSRLKTLDYFVYHTDQRNLNLFDRYIDKKKCHVVFFFNYIGNLTKQSTQL